MDHDAKTEVEPVEQQLLQLNQAEIKQTIGKLDIFMNTM